MRTLDLKNDVLHADVYHKLKEHRAKHWENEKAKLAKYLQNRNTELDRLPNTRWPTLLDKPEYVDAKQELQARLLERTPANSGMGSANNEDVKAVIANLEAILAIHAREMSSSARIAIRKFLRAVKHESHRPMSDNAQADPIYRLARSNTNPAPTNVMVAALGKLSAGARSVDVTSGVSVLTADPESFALYRAFITGVASAVEFGDDESLSALKHAARRAPLLADEQRARILQKIESKDSSGAGALIPDSLEDVAASLARIAGLEPPLLRGSAEASEEIRGQAFEAMVYLFAAA